MASMMGDIHGMKNGGHATFSANGKTAHVSYYSDPSKGDNGRVVPGATVGTYHVHDGDGITGRLVGSAYHGPHANTEGARKKGANPNAKGFAAQKAYSTVMTHLQGFHDRREPVDQAIGGPNGPLGRRAPVTRRPGEKTARERGMEPGAVGPLGSRYR